MIRDKVIGDIIDIIFTNRTTDVAHELAEQILSIPQLAIIDRETKTPEPGWVKEVGWLL